jgi:ribonucleoside-diphosphate reductase beta chain
MAGRPDNGIQRSLARMAEREPVLAAKLLLQALPAAAAPIKDHFDYRLVLDDIGSYRISIAEGDAQITPLAEPAVGKDADRGGGADGSVDFEVHTDASTFARLAAGASPLWLLLGGRLRIRGKRRWALKLRKLAGDLTMRDVARANTPDAGLLYRALPYAIDPAWTQGHRFTVKYEITPDETGEGGSWYVSVNDGSVTVTTEAPEGGPDSSVILAHATWLAIVRGEMTPNYAMQHGLSRVDGALHPVTVLGRWIERSEGRDDRELEREARQRAIQERRATWGSTPNGARRSKRPGRDGRARPGQGDPAHEAEARRRRTGGDLLTYEELYALWERQNWRAHEIDFSADQAQWLATPTESQQETIWSTASFYIGEERVAADLAPFLLAAPTGEIEVFLATQLVDETRHATFFDRFMAEVLALESEDLRGRIREMEKIMQPPWREVFDDALRGIAKRIQSKPDDLDLFVEGIVVYHMVIEGVLAMTGQHFILKYTSEHGLYPGFVKGFSLVEQDEHRHIAFGVRFLKEVCEQEPRYRKLIEDKIAELVPKAAYVLVPPYAEDPSNFLSYDYSSAELYGYAYRALKRRMSVVGIEVPPPEDLMPGPIAEPVTVSL